MAAAVADYTPAGGAASSKIEKGASLTLELERTPDILAELGAGAATERGRCWSGSPPQTGPVVRPRAGSSTPKASTLIVANDVPAPGAGFDVETNQVTLVARDGADDAAADDQGRRRRDSSSTALERLLDCSAGRAGRIDDRSSGAICRDT